MTNAKDCPSCAEMRRVLMDNTLLQLKAMQEAQENAERSVWADVAEAFGVTSRAEVEALARARTVTIAIQSVP